MLGWHWETSEDKPCLLHSFSPFSNKGFICCYGIIPLRETPSTQKSKGEGCSLRYSFYHHSEANCSLILPTAPFLPWFNWTWFIFELTSFNPFPTKKANPLWVTGSAAHHPGSEAEGGAGGRLSPGPGWWRVGTAEAVSHSSPERRSRFSAAGLPHGRAVPSELHANTSPVSTRQLRLLP